MLRSPEPTRSGRSPFPKTPNPWTTAERRSSTSRLMNIRHSSRLVKKLLGKNLPPIVTTVRVADDCVAQSGSVSNSGRVDQSHSTDEAVRRLQIASRATATSYMIHVRSIHDCRNAENPLAKTSQDKRVSRSSKNHVRSAIQKGSLGEEIKDASRGVAGCKRRNVTGV